MAFINPAQQGVQVSYLPTPQNNSYDVGGQQVTPPSIGDALQPYQSTPMQLLHPDLSPTAPILNGYTDTAHPIQHVAQMITDHANLIRQRLQAAHLYGGFAPGPHGGGDVTGLSPLAMVQRTASPAHSNLAALLAKFHSQKTIDPAWRSDQGGDFRNPNAPQRYLGRH